MLPNQKNAADDLITDVIELSMAFKKKRGKKQRQQVKSTESAKLPTHAPTEHYKIVLTITKHLFNLYET